MADVVVSVALEVAKCLLVPIGRQLSYLCNYPANFENLKAEVEKLTEARDGMKSKIVDARRKGDEIDKRVEKWLISADKTIDEAGKLIEDEEKAKKRRLMGLCPNLKKRYQLNKKAAMEEKAVIGLKEEAGKFDQISHYTVPEETWVGSVRDYKAFESRTSTLKDIQKALSDPNVSIFGVYGMGGIGKTTLAKEVARQSKNNRLFDEVVFAEVSQTPDIKKIQVEIAEQFGLKFRDETESRRASKLRERIKNEKKILIILDNIWKYLDLETVGIPYGDDHKGCKVLLTTRDRSVLLSMGSEDDFIFSIQVLNGGEAWRLFKHMAGDDVEHRKLKSTAMDIANSCGGLPIAITTIARALRRKSIPEWKNALQELRTPSLANFERVPAETYSIIELSYKYLRGEQLKKTFLLCSFIASGGGSGSTMRLFKYCMGLGIFQGVNTMEDARDKLDAFLQELKDSCLLINGDCVTFSIHDVVRDVAISIACRDQHVFTVTNEAEWEWPDEDKLKKCTTIFLRDCNIREFPEWLEFPKFELFSFSSEDTSFKIPESVFTGMTKLKVLNLHGMQLLSLPPSLDVLINLHTLCLDYGKFEDIAVIGKLKNLEILSFIDSDFEELPEEIGQLTKLRLLDLTYCKLKVIAPNVISSLSRLEELHMEDCSVEWEVERLNTERRNASLDELMYLPRLTTLIIDIEDGKLLPEGFFSRELERYKISIGGLPNWAYLLIDVYTGSRKFFPEMSIYEEYKASSRSLKLNLESTTICLENLQGVKNVEYLCLENLQGVDNVLFHLDTGGFPELQNLLVKDSPDLRCIIESMESVHCECDPFPLSSLEKLTLRRLLSLEKICHDRLKTESFHKLNTINVRDCGNLRNIFFLSTTKCLLQLQQIEVVECRNMEEIFAIEGEHDNDYELFDKIEFTQLSCLRLKKLPKLTSFYCNIKTPSISLDRQQELITTTSLFNKKVMLPNLEALELSEVSVEKIWHNQFRFAMSPCCFQSLTSLIIVNCDKLKFIFSSSIVRRFEKLQHLEIRKCMSLQEIITEEEGEDQVPTVFVFPLATTLILSELPELRSFCSGMHISEWPVLKNLRACSCDKVKVFAFEQKINKENQLDIPMQQSLFLVEKHQVFPRLEQLELSGKDIWMISRDKFPEHLLGSLKVLVVMNDDSDSFPLGLLEKFHNLDKLRLTDCSYKHTFSNEFKEEIGSCGHNLKNLLPQSTSFPYLTELNVENCKGLKNLVTSSKSLAQLVVLRIFGCKGMTEVVASEGDAAAKDEIIFSKLKHLHLIKLKSLTCFCSGNYKFNFPSLVQLLVIDCPQMKIFSGGAVSSSQGLQVTYSLVPNEESFEGDINTTIPNEGSFEVDINTTIQQLHKGGFLHININSDSD